MTDRQTADGEAAPEGAPSSTETGPAAACAALPAPAPAEKVRKKKDRKKAREALAAGSAVDPRGPRSDPAEAEGAAIPEGLSADRARLGSSRAADTLFRNAIRAELDIIDLAATKANIMISLNGFIISALMISGALLFNRSPSFLLPAAVFMLTSAASIIFALLAASPEQSGLGAALRDWAGAVWRRQARLRDLGGFIMRGRPKPPGDEMNLLIYEDRSRLDRAAYWRQMEHLLRDRDEIYRMMSDQLYWLGQMANRKFKLLNISYTLFRWGLLASVVVFFAAKSLELSLWLATPGTAPAPVASSSKAAAAAPEALAPGLARFATIFEPSAAQQLPDGRLLVVEDEPARALRLLTPGEDGTLAENGAGDLKLLRGIGRKLSDLEALSLDEAGRIYAATSHSPNARGERRPDREQLLRFEIVGNAVGHIASVTGLRDALIADAALAQAISAAADAPVDLETLNIEGMAYWRGPATDGEARLMLGLRAPLAGSGAIIVPVLNPGEMFDAGAAPRFGAPVILDLDGGGIRSISFDPVLGAFLIANETEAPDGLTSRLWRWSGDPAEPPAELAAPVLSNLKNIEAVTSITQGGQPRLALMGDNGNERKGRPATYAIIDYDQLAPR